MRLLPSLSLTHCRGQCARLFAWAAAATLALMLLAACDANPAATPPASTSTSTVPHAETPQPTTAMATPTARPEEGSLDANVTAFEVWQDYMPVVPPDGAPLYGVVTVGITHTEKLTPQLVQGTLTLTRASGDTVSADVPLTMQQQADDLGMLAPGPQTVTFTFGPVPTQATLTEGEMIGGTLALSVADEAGELALPEVALFFTH